MEPQDDNNGLSLQKAINAHEQAEAGLTDAQDSLPADMYATMMDRLDQNMTELRAEAERMKAAADE